ncbi:MAG: hypothetical protein ACM3JD_18185, partial [Rudaea sp.]
TKEVTSTFAQGGECAGVDEVTLEVLSPGEITDGSIALRLGLPGQSLIWLPALGSKEQSALVDGGADLHGSVAVLPTSFRQGLLDQIQPDLVILFAGRRLAEQPAAATLERLSLLNWLRTDERGDIELILDAEKLEVRTER